MSDETPKKLGGRPLKFTDPDALDKKIDEYFASCFIKAFDQFGNPIVDKTQEDYKKDDPKTWSYVLKQVKPFTLAGLAAFLDCSRDTLANYSQESHFPESLDTTVRDRLIDSIKRAREQIYAYTEERLFMPGVATGAIFSLKNNYSDEWKDKQEIEGSGSIIVESVNFARKKKEDEQSSDSENKATV